MSRSLSELEEAIAVSEKNYEQFIALNRKFVLIGDDFRGAFQNAEAGGDIRKSAQLFGDGVWAALRILERKQKFKQTNWTTRVGTFLTKLYPVARISLGLTVAIADVSRTLY
jgi:hypothetical protein